MVPFPGQFGDVVGPPDVGGDLVGEILPHAGVRVTDQQSPLAGHPQRRAEQLQGHRLGAGDPVLQQPLLADGQAVGQQALLVDGRGVGWFSGQPVGNDEVGVQVGAQHQVGEQQVGAGEQGCRLVRGAPP